jgi:type IV secretion system protein VirB8
VTDIPAYGRAHQIREPELEAYYAEVESFQRKSQRRTKVTNWFLVAGLGVSILSNLAQSVSIAEMLPLKRLLPVFYWVQTDGTIDATTSSSLLPHTQSDAATLSAVYQYVKDREGYSYANAKDAYDRIGAMSTEHVNAAYQHWFALSNPDSPQNTIGRRGQINIERIGYPTFVRDRVVQQRYRRIVEMYDAERPNSLTCKPPICTTWTATAELALIDDLPHEKRLLNPGGIVVTRYQVSEGAQ